MQNEKQEAFLAHINKLCLNIDNAEYTEEAFQQTLAVYLTPLFDLFKKSRVEYGRLLICENENDMAVMDAYRHQFMAVLYFYGEKLLPEDVSGTNDLHLRMALDKKQTQEILKSANVETFIMDLMKDHKYEFVVIRQAMQHIESILKQSQENAYKEIESNTYSMGMPAAWSASYFLDLIGLHDYVYLARIQDSSRRFRLKVD